MIKIKSSFKLFFSELFNNHLKEFSIITVLVVIDGLLLTFSVISIIPLTDLFFNLEENYSEITNYVIFIVKEIGFPISLLTFFLLFICLTFLKSLFSILINYQIQNLKYSIYKSLFRKLYTSVLNAKWMFFNDLGQGKLFNTFRNELSKVGDAAGYFSVCISSVLQLVFYLIIPIYLNFKLTLYLIFFSLILFFPYKIINKYSKKLGNKSTSAGNNFSASLQEMILNSKYFISIGSTKTPLNNSLKFLNNHIKPSIIFHVINYSIEQLLKPIFITLLLAIIVFSTKQSMQFSEYAAFFWSLLATVPLITKILNNFSFVINYLPSFDQFKTIQKKALKFKEANGSITFNNLKKNIIFKNVNFSYGNKHVLKNLNFSIKKNKINFLVGESGKGKSTIIDLLTGIQVPKKGEIFVNGKNLKKIDKKSFREKIGIVNQDLALFYDTIKNNVVLFEKNFSNKEIKKALQFSGSDKFISKLNKKTATVVGERGTQLSGGQRQRILLARSLLRKPELLILDEAINSLDKNSRKTIMKNLRKISLKTTIVIISHDYLNIDKDDNIIRF